jgi:membrane protein DedA with SNARE-associated domain
MSRVEYPQFALFAYSGGILWVSTFIGVGYFLGDRWESVQQNISHYFLAAAIAAAALLAVFLIWRKWGRGKKGLFGHR